MKKVESIWAELSAKNTQEVELNEEQKVELANVKELKSMSSKANSLQKKVFKQIDNVEAKGDVAYRATLDLNDSVQELKNITKNFRKDFDIISKQMKQLGMNPDDVPGLSSALQILNDSEQAVALGERQVKSESKGFKV